MITVASVPFQHGARKVETKLPNCRKVIYKVRHLREEEDPSGLYIRNIYRVTGAVPQGYPSREVNICIVTGEVIKGYSYHTWHHPARPLMQHVTKKVGATTVL